MHRRNSVQKTRFLNVRKFKAYFKKHGNNPCFTAVIRKGGLYQTRASHQAAIAFIYNR